MAIRHIHTDIHTDMTDKIDYTFLGQGQGNRSRSSMYVKHVCQGSIQSILPSNGCKEKVLR